mmetsp:Transcript_14615/g.28773  ORF Transcript_14615/g.28773 Transcript_14615/m.28773 type:complete len:385 (-) Transcript_14615:423-1577(-)
MATDTEAVEGGLGLLASDTDPHERLGLLASDRDRHEAHCVAEWLMGERPSSRSMLRAVTTALGLATALTVLLGSSASATAAHRGRVNVTAGGGTVPYISEVLLRPFVCHGASASLQPGAGDASIWRCNGGACIPQAGRCDGVPTCYDHSDEAGCGGPEASGPLAAGGQPADYIMQNVLKQHNHYRCLHGVPPLSWNPALAANAQRWAQQTGGVMRHSSPDFRANVAGFRQVGENLAKGATGPQAVKMWYDEIAGSPGGQGCITNFAMATGHYTQLVWKSTSQLGCGINGDLLVCQYGPAGNVMGSFRAEVLPKVNPSSQCGTSLATVAAGRSANPLVHGGQMQLGSPEVGMPQIQGGMPQIQVSMPQIQGGLVLPQVQLPWWLR